MISPMNRVLQSENMSQSILSFLDARELINTEKTCKAWRKFAEDPILWQPLCHKEWGDTSLTPIDQSWKKRYKIIDKWMKGDCRTEKITIAENAKKNTWFAQVNNELYQIRAHNSDTQALKITQLSTNASVFVQIPIQELIGFGIFLRPNHCILAKEREGLFKVFSKETGLLSGTLQAPAGLNFYIYEDYLISLSDGNIRAWEWQTQKELEGFNVPKLLTDSGNILKLDKSMRDYLDQEKPGIVEGMLMGGGFPNREDMIRAFRMHMRIISISGDIITLKSNFSGFCFHVDIRQHNIHLSENRNAKDVVTDGYRLVEINQNTIEKGNFKINLTIRDARNLNALPQALSLQAPCLLDFKQLGFYQSALNTSRHIPISIKLQNDFLMISKSGGYRNSFTSHNPPFTYIYVWNLKTEKLLFEKKFEGVIDTILSIDEDKLVFGTPDGLLALNFNDKPLKIAPEIVDRKPVKPIQPKILARIKKASKFSFATLSAAFKQFFGQFHRLLSRTIRWISEIPKNLLNKMRRNA